MTTNTKFRLQASFQGKPSKTARFVKAITDAKKTAKGPKAIVEQEAVLRKSFQSLEESTRYDVVNSLSAVDNDLSQQLLMNVLLDDPSPLVRHEAAFALGWIGNARCTAVLRRALACDPSLLVRHEAAMALAEFGSPADISGLQCGLKDRSKEVSISCQVALKRIRERESSDDNHAQGADSHTRRAPRDFQKQ